MNFLQECQQYFGTKDLYEILNVQKKANESQIKSAYRKKSLKVHPDRVTNEYQKENAKKAFQILTKVHYVLTNKESRKVYDETGTIITDDDYFSNLSTVEEFENYWRTLFPKIDTKKLDDFVKEYVGSEEEEQDLKKLYLKYEGDLNVIYEYHFYYDEDRVQQIINKLIKSGDVPAFDAFVKEPKSKKEKRIKRILKESSMAEKHCQNVNGDADSDLVKAIQKKAANNFDQMISKLEAKYSKSSKTKRRRN